MISIKDIEKLLSLSRIDVNEAEKETLRGEIQSILGYISEIEKAVVSIDTTPVLGVTHNVFREDGEPHESGLYTEKLLEGVPKREGNYISVKKIM